MSTIDSLSVELKSLVEKFIQLTKKRITKLCTTSLDIEFQLFCKAIPDCDRKIFLETYIFGGAKNYTNRSSYILFAKLLSDENFLCLISSIKQAVKEKSTLDNLREEIKKSINQNVFEKIILEELNHSVLEINSGDEKEKSLADFSQTKIQNLITEANRWDIDASSIMTSIRAAAMDPVLFFDNKVNIFSIIEITSGVPAGEKIN